MQQDLIYEIALSKTEGIGGVMFKQLLNTFGSAKEVFETPSAKLLKVPNMGKFTLAKIKENEEALIQAETIVSQSAKNNIRIVTFKQDEYPKKLKGIFEAPPILFFKGKGHLEYPKTLAIVGTRDASDYGKKSTEEIVASLKEHNVQIVSGLAYGIDIAAHKAALKNGLSTVGVLANSLETVYPSSHKKVALEIEETGLLISEQPFGTETKPSFFVARNRIIAALADATIVVESARKGGSMVTAEYANNYNKEVFAIPGGIFNKYSEGPNYLVSNNKAQIFTNTQDFVEWMKWDTDNQEVKVVEKEVLDLSKYTQEESKVLSLLMQNGEMLIDDLSWHSQIHLNKLASILLNLEFADLVKQSPGKKFALR
ncbi:DNA-processing protein DprA [Lacihabitans soyangensis]|uniref:DNA-protecting protein DprA n=1 Tax=Lacihabitans soyangensis TaxID=869394 RepID=A0AAE3GYC7_9BACT|nr:DNA-processing protein DprA [Lacihabitans soyangensis]MCP9761462.1 DNA-protecting protein DprA [Lacihabitans soyangensis]